MLNLINVDFLHKDVYFVFVQITGSYNHKLKEKKMFTFSTEYTALIFTIYFYFMNGHISALTDWSFRPHTHSMQTTFGMLQLILFHVFDWDI